MKEIVFFILVLIYTLNLIKTAFQVKNSFYIFLLVITIALFIIDLNLLKNLIL